MKHKPKSIQEAYDQLNKIIAEFESNEIDLDQAVSKYKEASALVKFLTKQLNQIEQEIEEINTDLKTSSLDENS